MAGLLGHRSSNIPRYLLDGLLFQGKLIVVDEMVRIYGQTDPI